MKVLKDKFHQHIFVEFLHPATVTLMGDHTPYNGKVIQENTCQIICQLSNIHQHLLNFHLFC
jgi:hypothetical protein